MIHRYPTEAAWLEARKGLLTASDTATAMGLNPYRKREDLFLEKTGQVDGFEGNERTRWGLRLQTAIAKGLSEEKGILVREIEPFTIAIHPDFPWLGATLDAEYSRDEGKTWWPVDLKNCQFDWGKKGCPLYYQVQGVTQAMIVGADRFAIAPLFGGCRVELYEFGRNPAFEALLLATCGEFMRAVSDFKTNQEATNV